jgi:methylmalonyl-CoA mutase C-terminal domain/subunit
MQPIRVLVAILGRDPYGAGATAVARALRDAGMEVLYLGCCDLPADLAKAVAEEGVDVIDLCCQSRESLPHLDPFFALLREQGLEIPVLVGGSALTSKDARAIRGKGAAATFGPTASAAEVVATVERLARGSRDTRRSGGAPSRSSDRD